MKTVEDVTYYIESITNASSICLNATVIFTSERHVISNGRKKRTVLFTPLADYLIQNYSSDKNVSISKVISQIRILIDTYRSLLKNVGRHCASIVALLNEKFEFPLDAPPPTPHLPDDTVFVDITGVQSVTPCNDLPTTPVKTRGDCDNCSSSKKANVSLHKTLKNEKSKHRKLQLFTADVKRKFNIRTTNQKLSRKELKIVQLKNINKSLEIKLKYLERKYGKLLNKADCQAADIANFKTENISLSNDVVTLMRDFKECKTNLKDIKLYSESLELELKEKKEEERSGSDGIIKTKSGKTYTFSVRRAIYSELLCDVPVKYCGHLLSIFAQVLCGKKLEDIPCPSTCAQMAYELGVLTTIQVIEFLFHQPDNICLSWDATTVDGCHINEIHLTTNRTHCLVLDVRHISGGKSSDYVTHIVTALTEAADVYARYSGIPAANIFSAIKERITSTLTDRAAVNACVTRQLCQQLEMQLLQLNCNIHPLDSIARYSKQGLLKLDKSHDITGCCYGSEGAAANLINAVSVLRFKDGTGDPVGFKNMLRRHNLPIGAFVRYVGNRIHVLFHLAGILVLHWRKVSDFIQMQCTAGGLLRSKLAKDLANEKIMAQVWALGVLGKAFSGPWMTKFYSGHMSNLDMRHLVQVAESQLKSWDMAPHSLIQLTKNVFGETLSPGNDDVLAALHSFSSGEVDVQVEAIRCIVQACLTVLQRQLKDFLTEDELPDDVKAKVSSAPTHNMASERTLGCLDKMLRRAPVATGGFLNGKVRSKMNRCTQWLDGHSRDVRKKLIDFSVSEARSDRVKKCIFDKGVEKEIGKRRKDMAEERSRKDRKKLVRILKKALQTKSLAELDSDFSSSVKELFHFFIDCPDRLIGTLFIHTLELSEFYGRVQCIESESVVVGYWGMEESESSSVDHDISGLSFFVDAFLGSVVFL